MITNDVSNRCMGEDWNSLLIFVSPIEWSLLLMMGKFTLLIANAKIFKSHASFFILKVSIMILVFRYEMV